MRGRPVRARAAGSETLEKEGQESCRRTGRVKPAGERGAPEWEEGFRAGPSPGRKPVRASGRGALSGNGRGTDTSAAAGSREPTRAGKDTVKGGQRRRSRGLDDGTRSFRSEALKTRTLGVPAGWNRPANRLAVRPAGRLRKPGGGERQVRKPAGHGGTRKALEGQEPREAPGPFPVKARGMP